MEREQIIKALECLTGEEVMFCRECGYNGVGAFSCKKELAKDAFALITSQEQRIKELTEKDEKLTKVITDLMREGETYLKQRDAFQNRVKYLEKENARLVEDNHILATEFKDNVKSDTVKKFAEVLCEGRVSNDPVVIAVKVAEKEMSEGV